MKRSIFKLGFGAFLLQATLFFANGVKGQSLGSTEGFAAVFAAGGQGEAMRSQSVLQANFPSEEEVKLLEKEDLTPDDEKKIEDYKSECLSTSVFGKVPVGQGEIKGRLTFDVSSEVEGLWTIQIFDQKGGLLKLRAPHDVSFGENDGDWSWVGKILVWEKPGGEAGIAPVLRLRLELSAEGEDKKREFFTQVFLGDVWYVAGGAEVGTWDGELSRTAGAKSSDTNEAAGADNQGGAIETDASETPTLPTSFRWVAYEKAIMRKPATGGDTNQKDDSNSEAGSGGAAISSMTSASGPSKASVGAASESGLNSGLSGTSGNMPEPNDGAGAEPSPLPGGGEKGVSEVEGGSSPSETQKSAAEIRVDWKKFESPPASASSSHPDLPEAEQEIPDSALAKAFSEEWQKQTGRPVLMIVLPGYRSLIGDWTADPAPAPNPTSVPETASASDANSSTPIPDIPSALPSIPFTNELEAASRFIGSRGLIWWHGAWEADYGIPQEDKGIVTLRSNYSENLPKLFQKWKDYKPGTQQFLIVQCPLSVRASGVSQIFLDSWKTADEKIDPMDTLQAIRFAQADYVKESWAKTTEAETTEAETTEAETTEAETAEAAAAKTEPVPKISLVLPIREVRVPERGSELLPVENLSISEAGRLLASVAHARDTETGDFEMGKVGDFDLEHKDKSSKEVLDFPTAKGWSWNQRTLEAYLPGEGQSESVLPRFKKVFQDPAEPVKKKEDFYLLAPEFDSKSP